MIGLELVPVLAAALSPAGLPTDWDHVFERHRGTIPIAYLRALAKRESDFKPYNTTGGAWGLLEVVMDVVAGFNKRNPGKNYTSSDRLDPDRNVEMATWQLRQIIRSYGKYSSRNMKEDWRNPEFVALLTMGWNSGWSDEYGVGRVAKYLQGKGIAVTAINVARHAKAAGATHFLYERGAGWAYAVGRLYRADLGPTPVAVGPPAAGSRALAAGVVVALLAVGAASTYVWATRHRRL